MILVIGDIILDEYWFGSSNRLSPEAVVPVVNIGKKETRLGGAGNVANNIKSLGGKIHLITSFGNDEKGKVISSLLKQKFISYTNISIFVSVVWWNIEKYQKDASDAHCVC